MFGLTGSEGNHGEDVKECYYYLDSTPTHSYMKFLYKYPQREFPYSSLVNENRSRGRGDREFELSTPGFFDDHRYFDVFVEYAKASVEDILVRITVENRGPEPARLHLLPTVWFRNTWSWGGGNPRPRLKRCGSGPAVIPRRPGPRGADDRAQEALPLRDDRQAGREGLARAARPGLGPARRSSPPPPPPSRARPRPASRCRTRCPTRCWSRRALGDRPSAIAVFGPQVAYFAPQILMEQDVHAPATPGCPASTRAAPSSPA